MSGIFFRNLFFVILLLLVCVFLSLMLNSGSNANHRVSSLILIGAQFIGVSLLSISMLRFSSVNTITPLFFFFAYVVIYKCFGPLVYILGNDSTRLLLSSHVLRFTEEDYFNTNVLNAVGLLFVLSGYLISKNIFPDSTGLMKETRSHSLNSILRWRMLYVLFAIGFLIKYIVIYPEKYGLYSIPFLGFLGSFSQLLDFVFGLMFFKIYSGSSTKYQSFVVSFLFFLHLLCCSLEFSKGALLVPMLFVSIFSFIGSNSKKVFGVWIILSIFIYITSYGFVNYARAELYLDADQREIASLSSRFDVARSYLTGSSERGEFHHKSDTQYSWLRLSYVGPQSLAMRSYKEGVEFSSLDNWWTLFIPRAVWADKPVGIGPGLRFYEFATGNTTTRVGVTVYADAYWNFGWTGVFFACLIIGLLLHKFTFDALNWIYTGKLIYFPLTLYSILFSIKGLNGWLINSLVSVVIVYFAFYLAINFFSRAKVKARY